MNIDISLMYHDVFHNDIKESGFQNTGAIPYKIKSVDFEYQVSMIARYYEANNLDKNRIALTFDDGGESFYSIIAPILEKHGFKGYFFITTNCIGTQGFMNSVQIIDLHRRGHFIGTHSHTHPKNIAELPYAEIEKEWTNSVEILNNIISEKVKVASIPGGFYSRQSRIALLKNGIEMVFTSVPTKKIKHEDEVQYILGRFTIKNGIYNELIIELLKNNSVRQYYEFVKWRGLALIRSLLGNNYYLIREVLLKNHK
ncbi:MAG: polysaccharide deacetylase family protein [Flavobacterium sp.]|nr:polysaccharide deacetylase family protein [Flavobacterium sp.]